MSLVSTHRDLLTTLQEISSRYDVELWGYYETHPEGGYLYFFHEGDRLSARIAKVTAGFYGMWHSHSPNVEEILEVYNKTGDFVERPSPKDIVTFIISRSLESVIIGPRYSIVMSKNYSRPEDNSAAKYVQLNVTASLEILAELGITDEEWTFNFAEQNSVHELRRRFGNRLGLKPRYHEMWINFCRNMGMNILIVKNEHINPKYQDMDLPELEETLYRRLEPDEKLFSRLNNYKQISQQIFTHMMENRDFLSLMRTPKIKNRLYHSFLGAYMDLGKLLELEGALGFVIYGILIVGKLRDIFIHRQ